MPATIVSYARFLETRERRLLETLPPIAEPISTPEAEAPPDEPIVITCGTLAEEPLPLPTKTPQEVPLLGPEPSFGPSRL